MDIAMMKQQLHEYIDHADERHLAAIYTLLEQQINPQTEYDTETLERFYDRRDKHLSGASESYTAEEVLQYIRSQKEFGIAPDS